MAGNDRQMIEELERDWRDALCNKDMDRLRALIHPDFVLVGTRSTGPFQMRRDEWLEAIQNREVNDVALYVHDATVLDDVIIGTVHARWRLTYVGRTIEDCVLLTDVWVMDEGRWQAIRRHSTPAPPGDCPDLSGGK